MIFHSTTYIDTLKLGAEFLKQFFCNLVHPIEIYFSNIRSIEVLLSPVPYSIHTSDGNQQPVPLHRLKELVTGDWGLHPGCVAVLLTTW